MRLEALSENNRKIFAKLANFKDFYLAGGTALALQISHRISVDFDLFSIKEIPQDLLTKVKNIFSEEKVIVSVNDSGELTCFIEGIKTTFLHYPFPVILPTILCEGVNFLSVSEIAATKAYTIGRRGSYKDYIDLYFIISEKHSSLEEIIALAEKKYGDEFNGRLFLEQLLYLEDIADTEIIFLKNKIDKEQLKMFFTQLVKGIKL